ncbi:MAG: hypothetical protein J6K32_10625 [Clostridia bacterium]|nr:hypothetical protein [Clostridia bacterium]
MEMSLESPRPERQSPPVRGPHGGWKPQEIAALQQSVADAASAGESLRSVFDRLALELGRKPNSIRNFYYAQLRADTPDEGMRPLPFETFSRGEVEQLVRSVLVARAQGMSVRACVRQLAGGDRTKMLRYQNKYRSTVRTRPELVRAVMQQLAAAGTPFVSPYAPEPGDALPAPDMDALRGKAAQTGDEQIAALMRSLDHLLSLAASAQQDGRESDAQRRADRLRAQCDMLRIELDDGQTRLQALCSEAGGMASLVREYIALPRDERVQGMETFCRLASERVACMESAMLEAAQQNPYPALPTEPESP